MRRALATIDDPSGCPPIRGEASLLAAGWRRRYLADAERADEARALYQSLGFDVLLRAPRASQLQPECEGCSEVACRDYLMVYTRERGTHE